MAGDRTQYIEPEKLRTFLLRKIVPGQLALARIRERPYSCCSGREQGQSGKNEFLSISRCEMRREEREYTGPGSGPHSHSRAYTIVVRDSGARRHGSINIRPQKRGAAKEAAAEEEGEERVSLSRALSPAPPLLFIVPRGESTH